MNDVSFKDIRVLPGQLELKGNTGKTLADLVHQLQSGSVLRGLVVGATPKGEIIFHTAIGRFASPNPMGLVRGDTITIRLAKDGEQVGGTIIKINNADPNIKESISLAFVKEKASQSNINFSSSSRISSAAVNSSIAGGASEIHGKIAYLNLTKLDQNSLVYKSLQTNMVNANNKTSIVMKVLPAGQVHSNLQIAGEVSMNNNSNQMIKTDFGVVETQSTKFPVGQKLNLEIMSINNVSVKSDMKQSVTDFIVKITENWNVVKKLSIVPDKSINGVVGTKFSISSANTQLGDNRVVVGNQATLGQNISISKPGMVPNIIEQGSGAMQMGSFKGQALANSLITSAVGQSISAALDGKNAAINFSSVVSSSASDSTKQVAAALNIPGSDNLKNVVGDAMRASVVDGASKLNEISFNSLKVSAEAIQSSSLLSSLRINTRKLKNSLDQEFIKTKGINIEGKTGKESDIQEHQPSGLNRTLRDSAEIDTIKKLSSDFAGLRELLSVGANKAQQLNETVTYLLPFYDGAKIVEEEVQITRTKDDMLRFVIETSLDYYGDIRLDGLVKFEKGTQIPRNFDLIFVTRRGGKVDNDLQRKVSDIFLANQDITGIRGHLKFDEE